MDCYEYERIQKELSDLLQEGKLVRKGITGKRLDGYLEGVKAAKSALSAYNPKRR